MRTISFLESFLFLFALSSSFAAVGNAYPIRSSGDPEMEDLSGENNISKSSSISADDAESYMCVYIPPDLDSCNFISYQKSREYLKDAERKLSEKRMRKLLKNNKVYLSCSTVRVPETDELLKQKPMKTIIYKIQKCKPSRLPFTLPLCTDEDFSNKENEIRGLYPFTINGSFEATYEFPVHNL